MISKIVDDINFSLGKYLFILGIFYSSLMILFLFEFPIPFLLIVSGLIFLIILYDFKWGIYLLVFIVPFSPSIDFINIGSRSIGLPFEYMISSMIILSWIINRLLNKNYKIMFNYLNLIIFTLIIFTVLSIFRAVLQVGFSNSLSGVTSFVGLFQFVLVFYIIFELKLDLTEHLKIVKLILIAGAVSSIISLIHYLFFLDEVYRLEPFFDALLRSENVKANPNTYAGFQMIVCLLGIGFIKYFKNYWKYLAISASILSLIVILLTKSRSSLLGLVVGLLFIAYYNRLKIIPLLTLLLFIPIFLSSQKYLERYSSMWQIITSERIHKIFIRLNEKDLDWERIKVMGLEGYRTDVVSGALRITAWIDGVKLISNRPFLGYGYKLNYLYSNWQTSENYFLDIWIMIGVFGFMNILLIFLYLLKYSWRFLNSKNLYSYHYSRFYLSFLVSITVISLTGSVLFSPKLASYFWILNSLLLGLSNEKNSHSLT